MTFDQVEGADHARVSEYLDTLYLILYTLYFTLYTFDQVEGAEHARVSESGTAWLLCTSKLLGVGEVGSMLLKRTVVIMGETVEILLSPEQALPMLI